MRRALRLFSSPLLGAILGLTSIACGGGSPPSKAHPPPGPPEPREKTTHWFDYDPAATPLDVRSARIDRRDDATLVDLTYASPRGGRVPAYLVLPPAGPKPPFPAVLFLHWGNGDRTEFLPDALALAKLGVVSLLPDAPFARPAPWYRPLGGVEDRIVYTQTVVDTRRAIDLLLARSDVDPARIALVGHSFGAQVAGVVAGVDARPRSFVIMAGVPSLSAVLRDLHTPDMDRVRDATPREVFEAYVREIAPLDAQNFVGTAGQGAWLFQYGTFDTLAPPSLGEAYAKLVNSGTTEMKTYDAAQGLNTPTAFADRIAWLRRRLAVAP